MYFKYAIWKSSYSKFLTFYITKMAGAAEWRSAKTPPVFDATLFCHLRSSRAERKKHEEEEEEERPPLSQEVSLM